MEKQPLQLESHRTKTLTFKNLRKGGTTTQQT